MRVLVTGATGFLGSHIAEQLAHQGHSVRVLLRRTSDRSFLRGIDVEEALGDVTQPDTLPAAVDGVEAIVHAAGLVKARSAEEFEAVNAYGRSKLKAEQFVRSWAGDPNRVGATIIRPPVVYGPRDRQLLTFFQLARWRLAPLLGDGANSVSCVYVEDAARAAAIAAAAGDAPSATYTVDDGSVYTWRDLLAAVEQAVGRKALRIPSPP